MKLRDLLHEGIEKLNIAGVDDADYDARELLKQAYGYDTSELLLNLERGMCPGATGGTEPAEITECPGDCGGISTFRQSINMRCRRVPLQQILGHTGFMGLDFKVNADVLIPRQDTEILAETVLSCEKDKNIRLLDLCTGSGCIAVSLKKHGGYSHVAASDISEKALNVALRNASLNNTEIKLYKSDLFADIDESFDVIVSNPPYIETDVIDSLEPEVREHDPRIALDGGKDGLDFYRRIISGATYCEKKESKESNSNEAGESEKGRMRSVLKLYGRLYLEIGYNQKEAVAELMEKAGFKDIDIVKDLAGLDRVVYGKRSF